ASRRLPVSVCPYVRALPVESHMQQADHRCLAVWMKRRCSKSRVLRWSRGWWAVVRIERPPSRGLVLLTPHGGMPAHVHGDGTSRKAFPRHQVDGGRV